MYVETLNNPFPVELSLRQRYLPSRTPLMYDIYPYGGAFLNRTPSLLVLDPIKHNDAIKEEN